MEIHGLVQTSLNLGILVAEQTALTATFCVRSSWAARRRCSTVASGPLMARWGHCLHLRDYPAWEYRQDSSLRT